MVYVVVTTAPLTVKYRLLETSDTSSHQWIVTLAVEDVVGVVIVNQTVGMSARGGIVVTAFAADTESAAATPMRQTEASVGSLRMDLGIVESPESKWSGRGLRG